MADVICGNCHTHEDPKIVYRGSIFIEVALYLFLCFPGVAYTLWRRATRRYLCRMCDSSDLVLITSERGVKLLGGRPT